MNSNNRLNRRDFIRRSTLGGVGLATLSDVVFKRDLLGRTQSRPLIMAISADALTLDPHASRDSSSNLFRNQIFEPLVIRELDGTLVPWLSTGWEFENTRSAIFTLREGVIFHNGERFDAETVKANFDRFLFDQSLINPIRGLFSQIDSVEVIDALRVRFTMREPMSLLLARLSNVGMLPLQHLKESSTESISSSAIGTGPYSLVDWQRGAQIRMKRYENYWATLPEIRDAVIRVIPDPSTQLLELLSQNIDLILLLDATNVSTITSSGVANVMNFPANVTIGSHFNPRGSDSPLQNILVRQALNLAVNTSEIVEALVGPYGQPLGTIVTPLAFGFNPSIAPFGFDPEGAVRLLKDAGYPDGFSTSMQTVPLPSAQDFSELVAGYLEEVGVDVELTVLGFGEAQQQFNTRTIANEIFIGLFSVPAHDAQATFDFIVKTGGLASYYSNDEADALIEVTSKTFDSDVRRAALYRVQEILKDEPIAIYSHTQDDLLGVNNLLEMNRRPNGSLFFKDWRFK